MITSSARVRTEHAKEYLAFLVSVSQRNGSGEMDDDAHARLRFQKGICELAAGDSFLDISITANSISDAAMLEDIVSDRLDDAASGEELRYQWITAPEASRLKPAMNSFASSPIRVGLFRAIWEH